jgi:hypothetical protein
VSFELFVALASFAGYALKLRIRTERPQQGIRFHAWIAEETALHGMLQHVQAR